MTESAREIQMKIDQAEAEIAEMRKLQKEREEIEKTLTPEQNLAITLHKVFCNSNHTDGCFWHYDRDNDSKAWTTRNSNRATYLEYAENMLKKSGQDADTITSVVLAWKNRYK